MAVKPEKSPSFNFEIPAARKLRRVIVARWTLLTSSAELTSGIAATMASRTCGVRSLTGIMLAYTELNIPKTINDVNKTDTTHLRLLIIVFIEMSLFLFIDMRNSCHPLTKKYIRLSIDNYLKA